MDPVSVATAAAQFIGLAGQGFQGICWLRKKLKDIKSAPRLIRNIHYELGVFENTFGQLSTLEPHQISDEAAKSFEITLATCEDIVDSLFNLFDKHGFLEHNEGGMKKLYKRILADDKRSDFEEYLRRLERAKSSLLATMAGMQLQATDDFRRDFGLHTRHVEQSLDRVETGILSVHSISKKTYSNTVETKIKLEEVIDIAKSLDRSIQDFRADMPALVERGVRHCLEEKFLECLKNRELPSPKEVAKSARSDRMIDNDGQTTKNTEYRDVTFMSHASEAPFSLSRDFSAGNSNMSKKGYLPEYATSKQALSKTCVRVKSVSRSFALPIGFVQTKSTQRIVLDTSNPSNSSEAEVMRIEISFIPFRWLSSKGQVVSIDRARDQYNRSSWKFTPRVYNVISDNSMIFRACSQKDVSTVQSLFKYHEASLLDVNSSGASLLYCALSPLSMDTPFEASKKMIQFLISEGADPTQFVSDFLNAYIYAAMECAMADSCFDTSTYDVATVRDLDEIWRLCLQHCEHDPFYDLAVLEMLWDATLGGRCVPPLDAAYLFHDQYTGLENLVFENPDKVFSDLIADCDRISSGAHASWVRLIDQQYETLAYLCLGVKDSLKAKVFSKSFSTSVRWQEESCFCASNTDGSHLLLKLLYNTSIFRTKRSRQKTLRQHVRRMVILLLENGEDPQRTCSCKAKWQSSTGNRSAMDIAASSGLLGVWLSALEECGFDSVRIFDEWRLEGVPQLFDEVEESSMVTTSLMSAGRAIYTALSAIV